MSTGAAKPEVAPWRACEGFVFVVTYGRSGSTVLLNLLNGIEGYCIRGENANSLFPLYEAWAAVAQSSNLRFLRHKGRSTIPEDPWYGGELIRPQAFRTRLVAAFCDTVLNLPPGTRVGGFKEIRYPKEHTAFTGYLDFIAAAFPEAKFIFNTRNHGAVARSAWYADRPEAKVRARLAEYDAQFEAYAEAHPERSIRLHYDAWKGRPHALRPLFDFLDVPFDEAQVARILDTQLLHLKRTKD